MNSIKNIIKKIDSEFTSHEFGKRKFPHLFVRGIENAAVHSAGVSYINALGIENSIPSIAEYPISVHSPPAWKSIGRVYPDSIWFHPKTGQPWIAFEFERFERGDENKIREKVENLAISCHQSNETIKLAVFVYWLRSSRAPKSITALFDVFKSGCVRHGITILPPACKLMIFKFVMCESPNLDRFMINKPNKFLGSHIGSEIDLLVLDSIQKIQGAF